MYAIAHDAWKWRGLGKIAARIWHILGYVSVEEMPAKLGVTPLTVRRHLARMERLGLVRRSGGRWERVDDGSALELAALLLGVSGEGERQRRRHQAERVAFHLWREGFDQMTSDAPQRRTRPASHRPVAKGKPLVDRSCPVCGQSFTPRPVGARYCSLRCFSQAHDGPRSSPEEPGRS